MNLIELLFFVAAAVLSGFAAKFLFVYLGWWSVPVGCAIGFGAIYLFILLLNKLPARRTGKSI